MDAKFLRNKGDFKYGENGKYAEKGEKLILVDGENSGEVFIAPQNGYLGSTFKKLWLSGEVFEPYLLNFLEFYRLPLKNSKRGVAIPHLDKGVFFNLLLPLPPLNEQKRIVAKIEELAPLIEEYGSAEQKLSQLDSSLPENLKKSILQEAIQGKLVPQLDTEPAVKQVGKQPEDIPFDIPDKWKWIRLGDTCEIARGGSPRPIKQYLTDSSDGINWIKIGDSDKGGKYISSTKEKIIPKGISKSRMVHVGDFLLTNSMSFGRPYILKINGCIHDGWLVLSKYQKCFDINFLYYVLSSAFAFHQFCGVVSGAVVKNLNIDKVSNAFFPIPPIEEQKRIVAKIDELFQQIDRLKH